MGKKYLIDTNIISHLFSNKISDQGKKFVQEIINTNFIISVVIEIEVLTYHESPQLMPLIEEFVNLAVVLPLTKEIAKKSIELRRNSRNNKKLKLGDAIIGATALIHELILLTDNIKDFINIEGLQIVNPHSL